MENSGQNMLFQIDLIVWEKARELLTYQYTLRSLNYLGIQTFHKLERIFNN